jgi:hypothetical protein
MTMIVGLKQICCCVCIFVQHLLRNVPLFPPLPSSVQSESVVHARSLPVPVTAIFGTQDPSGVQATLSTLKLVVVMQQASFGGHCCGFMHSATKPPSGQELEHVGVMPTTQHFVPGPQLMLPHMNAPLAMSVIVEDIDRSMV